MPTAPHEPPAPDTDLSGLRAQVAELQAALAAAHRELEQYRAVLDAIPGVAYQFALAPDGTPSFPYVSAGSRELYEVEPEDAQRDPALLLGAPLPDHQPALEASIATSAVDLTPWEWEGLIATRGGKEKWVRGVARPVRLPDGGTRWDGMLMDVTARRRAEQEQARLQESVIEAQRATLAELSTPLIPISDDVMVMPLVGTLDTHRAQAVFEALLTGLERSRARRAILDITGVAVVDTHVANLLLRAARAARLLGVEVMLTGIKPEVAQTIVNIGMDLDGLRTSATLQSGIEESFQRARARG